MADLDGRVDGVRGGSREDRSVAEQHGGCTVVVVVRESLLNEPSAGAGCQVKECGVCRANLNPDNSSGTSIPSDNLKPTARLDPASTP